MGDQDFGDAMAETTRWTELLPVSSARVNRRGEARAVGGNRRKKPREMTKKAQGTQIGERKAKCSRNVPCSSCPQRLYSWALLEHHSSSRLPDAEG